MARATMIEEDLIWARLARQLVIEIGHLESGVRDAFYRARETSDAAAAHPGKPAGAKVASLPSPGRPMASREGPHIPDPQSPALDPRALHMIETLQNVALDLEVEDYELIVSRFGPPARREEMARRLSIDLPDLTAREDGAYARLRELLRVSHPDRQAFGLTLVPLAVHAPGDATATPTARGSAPIAARGSSVSGSRSLSWGWTVALIILFVGVKVAIEVRDSPRRKAENQWQEISRSLRGKTKPMPAAPAMRPYDLETGEGLKLVQMLDGYGKDAMREAGRSRADFRSFADSLPHANPKDAVPITLECSTVPFSPGLMMSARIEEGALTSAVRGPALQGRGTHLVYAEGEGFTPFLAWVTTDGGSASHEVRPTNSLTVDADGVRITASLVGPNEPRTNGADLYGKIMRAFLVDHPEPLSEDLVEHVNLNAWRLSLEPTIVATGTRIVFTGLPPRHDQETGPASYQLVIHDAQTPVVPRPPASQGSGRFETTLFFDQDGPRIALEVPQGRGPHQLALMRDPSH